MTSLLRTTLLMLGAAGLAAPLAAAPPRPGPARAAPLAGDMAFSGPAAMGPLLRRWQAAFARRHPGIRFVDRLGGRDTAIYGIEMRTADIALLDRPINPFERYGTYERSWIFPVEIEVATQGSAAGPGSADAATTAIYVRADNPLDRLTLAQLDGIFGAERDGGFDRLNWDEGAARGAGDNLRTWRQLGVGGALADTAIRPYAPAARGNGVLTFFQSKVMHGGAMRNEATREYADPRALFADLARDPAGIAHAPIGAAPPGFKVVALSTGAGSPFVRPTRATLADRSYPLAQPVYVYFTIDTPTGQLAEPRVDPRVMAFMRYVLSPAGQAEVARDGRYLPLAPAVAARQLAALTSTAVPVERP